MKIILHADFGSGFGTTVADPLPMITDVNLIEAIEAKNDVAFRVHMKQNYPAVYIGPSLPTSKFARLRIFEAPDNKRWRLTEYDGYESLEIESSLQWTYEPKEPVNDCRQQKRGESMMNLPYPVDETPIPFIRPGEWNDEPNVYTWQFCVNHEQFSCAIIRHNTLGHLCGYVKLPEDHIFSEDAFRHFNVHGGITYKNNGWIGFDCAHSQDFTPAASWDYGLLKGRSYRNFQYVKAEVERLCQQIAAYPSLSFWLGADAEKV